MWNFLKKQSVDSVYLQQARDSVSRVITEKEIGFSKIETLQKALESTLQVTRPFIDTCETVAVLGVGGSALGSQALIQALLPEAIPHQKIIFFDNIDSQSFYRKLQAIHNPAKTLFLLISKSGSTIETLTQAEFLHLYLQKKYNTDLKSKSLVITEARKNPLFDWMDDSRRRLEVPLNVGGRYSVLTPVGLAPAALLGLNIAQIIQGAQSALENTHFVEELVAQFLKSFSQKELTTYFFKYCDDLDYFGMWVEQLWAESLGKKNDNRGGVAPAASVPISLRGATDQHSVLQQIAEGVQKKMVCFLRVQKSETGFENLKNLQFQAMDVMLGRSLGDLMAAEVQATEESLHNLGLNTLSIGTRELTEESIGFLLMSFELTVAALGLALNIDPFNQPGVEHGKVITRALLAREKNL